MAGLETRRDRSRDEWRVKHKRKQPKHTEERGWLVDNWIWVLSCSIQVAVTHCHQLGGLNNKRLFLSVLVAGSLISMCWWGPTSWLAHGHLHILSSHDREQRGRMSSLSLLQGYSSQYGSSIFMTKYLLKIPPPRAITLGLWFQYTNSEEIRIYIHKVTTTIYSSFHSSWIDMGHMARPHFPTTLSEVRVKRYALPSEVWVHKGVSSGVSLMIEDVTSPHFSFQQVESQAGWNHTDIEEGVHEWPRGTVCSQPKCSPRSVMSKKKCVSLFPKTLWFFKNFSNFVLFQWMQDIANIPTIWLHQLNAWISGWILTPR